MIRISNIKSSKKENEESLKYLISKKTNINADEILSLRTVRRSLDARDKNDIHYVYTADIIVNAEERVLRKNRNNRNVAKAVKETYCLPAMGTKALPGRPVIVGSGPAGLFCAYMLALNGYRPLLIEQGEPVEERHETVEAFWAGKAPLNPYSNVQYGEGGAGTFSDGKLNSSVRDKGGRNGLVLKIFADHGAKKDILYDAKPHIGTDQLRIIVKNIRDEIIKYGGEVLFNTRLAGINVIDGRIENITVEDVSRKAHDLPIKERYRHISCSILVPAIGHSNVETFHMFQNAGLQMEAKAFAMGVRVEHTQEMINRSQYGNEYSSKYKDLPPADYKLTYHAADGHSVYSFCMCPGGYVVDSSSEERRLCINGMSYSGRDGANANSAIIVSVTPEDTGADTDIMAGFEFQKTFEQKAWQAANGRIPSQTLQDFRKSMNSEYFCSEKNDIPAPQHQGNTQAADLTAILPEFMCADISEAFACFGRIIKGFDSPDTILSAIESRTSSPVRIIRDEVHESNIKGIFPCGEGAGYAGGIMSAAIDGIRIFEEIYSRYKSL